MPRPIIGTKNDSRQAPRTEISRARARSGVSGPKLEQLLRQRRSDRYIEQLAQLDAGRHQANQDSLNKALAAIEAEFPEVGLTELPLGIVSRCYLGPPYVVHICDLAGGIIEHFESGKPMPNPFERARSLALRSAYVFVEVYADRLRAISRDGSVSVVDR